MISRHEQRWVFLTKKNASHGRVSPARAPGQRRSRRSLFLVEVLEERALLTTFTVTDNSDNPADVNSLRYAVNHLAIGSAPGTNTINFAPSLSGATILLTPANGPLTISSGVTINGLGARQLTVDGGGQTSDFLVWLTANASISGLTITGGSAAAGSGGGFTVGALSTLTLTNCEVAGNTSAYDGGGILNNLGTVNVQNSLIDNNSAPFAGAIENDSGALTVTNSTIALNHATATIGLATAGGIASYSALSVNASVTLANDTFSGNTVGVPLSGYDLYAGFGLVPATSSVTLFDTILASASLVSPAYPNAKANTIGGATITSLGYNVSTDSSISPTTGDQLHVNPLLGSLQNNGGLTNTEALGIGSPAMGTGSTAGVTLVNDQRGPGFARIVYTKIDVGAFQTQAITPPSNQTAVEGAAKCIQLGSFVGNTGATSWNVTVNWGDGSSATQFTLYSAGTIPMQVHDYGEEGTYNPTVTVSDNIADPPVQSNFMVNVSDPSVIGSNVSLAPIPQGVATGPIALATFTDPGGAEPNQYTPGVTKISAVYSAIIDWGDGTSANPDTQPGTITFQSGTYTPTGTFTVTGPSHTYLAPGVYTIAVTINHETSTPTVVYDSIDVTEQDNISVTGTTLTGNPGQALTNVTVGSFTDAYPFTDTGAPTSASSYTAEINWGDGGSFVPVTITPNRQGGYNLTSSHTYTSSGIYDTTLFVEKNGEPNDHAYGYGEADIAPTLIVAQGATGTATEGVAYTGPVATITTNNFTLQASDFAATISWSPGAAQTATINGSNGFFTVTGSYVFPDEGTFSVKVKITEPIVEQPGIQPDGKGIPVVAVTGTVNVQEADVLTPHGLTIAGTVGTVRSGTVATFSDTYLGNTATDFNAMINWGDGAITPGTVSGGSGTFAVSGSHAYSRAGNFKAQVTLNDDAPGTATATANTLFQITSSVVPGVVTSNTAPVVVFTDSVFDLALSQVGTKKKG